MGSAAETNRTRETRVGSELLLHNQNPAVCHYLDAEQAASFLGGLNSRTVTRWAREGYIPAYPLGEGKRRLWRFTEDDLEQWMLTRRTGQGTLPSATDAPTGG